MTSTGSNTFKSSDFVVEKLRGSENYHNWIFAMENLLQFKGLGNCIIPSSADDNIAEETDVNKLVQAKSTLVLSIDPSLFVHVRNSRTALGIWRLFSNMYEDQGILGTVSLLLNLFILSNLRDLKTRPIVYAVSKNLYMDQRVANGT